MNKIIKVLLVACLMATSLVWASCGTSGDSELREFAQKYINAEDKAWSQGDTSDLEKLEDPNVVIHNAGFGDTTGWDAHKQTILGGRAMISGMQMEWKYLTGEGNHFAMAYKSQFTIPGETPEASLEGTNDSVFVFRLDNGRVAEIWINGSTTMVPVISLQEFAQKYIDAEDKAWSQGDTSDLEKLEAPNVVIHNAGFEDTTGWEAHKQTILGARGMISGIQQEWKYLTGEGNHFAMAYKSHFTIPGETPETSMEGINDSIFLFRLDKGRIIEIWMNGSTTIVPASTGQ